MKNPNERKNTKRCCWGRVHMPQANNPCDLWVPWPQNLLSTYSPSPQPHKPKHIQNVTLPHPSISKSLTATSHSLPTSPSNSFWHSYRIISLPSLRPPFQRPNTSPNPGFSLSPLSAFAFTKTLCQWVCLLCHIHLKSISWINLIICLSSILHVLGSTSTMTDQFQT